MEDGEKQMKENIGAESPFVFREITIIPLFRSRTTMFPGGRAGEKKPIGILIHTGATLHILSFTGSFAWWDDLTESYPGMKVLKPVFPEKKSEI